MPVCPQATPGTAQCFALRGTGGATPAAGTAISVPHGYGAADIQSAYALPTGSEGTGMTVAVVDAGTLPTAEADVASYRSYYGLPPCTSASGCFKRVNQTGGTDFSGTVDEGWGLEIALDIDMVSAACPNCKILLVEAKSSNLDDLGEAVDTAVSMGAVAVSNSYGGIEYSNTASQLDPYYNHPGVAITVATGDCGYHCIGVFNDPSAANYVSYPSASRYVIAVGGTKLTRAPATTRGWTEIAWGNSSNGGAGSGCSQWSAKPIWQSDPGCGARRTQADISAIADPSPGVAVYFEGAWNSFSVGGTSAATPIIAATAALAGRPAAGTYPASYLYAHADHLNDVVGGNNDVTWGTCPPAYPYLCNGVVGYDGPTGLGTPNGTGAFAPPTAPGKPGAVVASSGNGFVDLSWPTVDNGGSPITGYAVTETEAGLGSVSCTIGSATSCSVGGLTNGVEYTFTIHAINVVGPGIELDPSNPVTLSSVPTPPGKPTGVSATAGSGMALVSWAAGPANGSPINGYLVTSAPDGKTCATTGATSCTVSGLTNGQPYTFTVTATNSAGTSPASNPSNTVTPAGVPDKPIGVTGAAGLGSALVSWSAPAANGSPISGYTVTSSPGGKTCQSGGLSCTISGLSSGVTYTFTVHATNGVGNGPESDPSAGVLVFTGATYHAIAPGRALDSRSGFGAGLFHSHVKQSFQVTGLWGVPAGAVAVTGNVTIVSQTRNGYVTLAPLLSQGVQPITSTINFPAGDIRANGVTVALGAGGKLDAMYWSSSTADTVQVIFDVTGYFANDTTGATYHAIAPGRALDSRSGFGAGLFHSHVKQSFQVTGLWGVPAGAVAVTGNVTIVSQTRNGYVTLAPLLSQGVQPITSTINFPAGDIRANGVTVALGAGGKLDAMYWSSSTADTVQVIFDVTGYFANDTTGATYHAIAPGRALDSRSGFGAGLFHSHVKQSFQVTGLWGVPAGAVAVTGNVTIVSQTRNGYVTLAPLLSQGVQPITSTINFPAGDIRANGVTVALGAGGKLDAMYWSSSTADTVQVIFDVTGYFN